MRPMASGKGQMGTETTLQSQLSSLVAADALVEPGRQKSLKRARETTPASPSSTTSNGGDMSPSKIARLVGFARQSPVHLTGAAAQEEDRRRRENQDLEAAGTSDNPGHRVLSELIMSASDALSRPQDAPHETEDDDASRSLQPVADAANMSDLGDASPQTVSSTGGAGSLQDVARQVVHSPGHMDLDTHGDGSGDGHGDVDADGNGTHVNAAADQRMFAPHPEDEAVATSLSYPGVLPQTVSPHRGLSLPMAPANMGVASASTTKKHKCPYCDTEFTRHHNLKSHLLTHSQEKPYECPTCTMRFRRLHDLKRHGKLHTGEKPHICPKCQRRFARGDALARHSKGPGGCAGRRTSMGGFAEDEFEGSGVDGDESAVIYNAAGDLTEEERRRLSLPGFKAPQQQLAPPEGYPHSSTYPPAGPRTGAVPGSGPGGTGAGVYPPGAGRPAAAGTSYSGGMTESPRPLSPRGSQSQARQHPSFREQQAGSAHGMSKAAQLAWLSQYPPADGKLPEDNAAAASSTSSGQPPGQRQRQSASGARGKASGVPATAQASANNLFAAGEQGIWAYLQHLDDRVKQLTTETEAGKRSEAQLMNRVALQDQRIASLTAELDTLRRQVVTGTPAAATVSPTPI